MVESLPSDESIPQKRRSTRIVQAVPITVTGVDALGQPFKERTSTVMVNCHGCKYQSKHYVPKNSTVTIEVPRPDHQLPGRSVQGRVVWVQRPRTVRELFQIGLEFEEPGNVWGIAFPPEDWFPCAGEEAPAPAPAEPNPTLEAVPPASTHEPVAEAVPTEAKVHLMPSHVAPEDAQAAARDMAKIVADAKETLDKSLRRGVQSAINEEMTVVRQQLDAQLHDAVEHAIKVSMERVSESAAKKMVQQAAERTAALVEEARKSTQVGGEQLDEKIRQAVQSAVGQVVDQAALKQSEQATAQLEQVAQSAVEQARRRLDEISASSAKEIARKTDEAIAERAHKLEPMLEQSAQRVMNRLSGELDQRIAAKLESAQKVASELARAQEQAAQVQSQVREQVERASSQALQESLERIRQETAKFPAEIEQSAHAALSKLEEELEQKSTEAQHATYEALLKASEWYQKKAQTSMQSTLEKTVEQSTSTLRHRAAEISSLVASELDHYGRTYVEHSQAQIEEAAQAVVDRQRGKLGEAADVAGASLADRIQQLTSESLRRFEHASREALEKARSDMEFNREGSLEAFQKKLDDRMVQGIEQARTYLQSQLVPVIEQWEAQRQAQQQQWIDQLKKSTDESIEQYKARLENASNSWLLASAATLGQSSQAVLDTLVRSAEKRIRETCADVFAGMGDTLKQRLLGISGQFGADEDDEVPPKKK